MKRNAEDDVAEARAEELASKKRKVDQDDDDDDVEDEEEKEENTSMQQYTQAGVFRRKCPYLDTVSRQKLDFDQQKICSVTLTNMNVYACLVCGKFFQGRGKSTPAFTHSVQAGHFVFINLQDTRTFCLPDGYEIVDAALNDVKKCLAPSFAPNEVSRLNSNSTLARDVYGVSYLPGFVGLNNLKSTDYLNVVLHAFSHISPLRDFFLLPDNYAPKVPSGVIHGSAITRAFGEVVRKMWSKDNFKSVISPQEFMHVVTSESKNRFVVGQQSEAIDLFVWLMGELHRGVLPKDMRRARNASSVVTETFQGQVEVRTFTKLSNSTNGNGDGARSPLPGEETKSNGHNGHGTDMDTDAERWKETTVRSPFNYLSLDIPPNPLFRDSQGGLIIPQIPLFEILKKYDGETYTDKATAVVGGEGGLVRKQYRLKQLPQYLVFHLARFTKNNFTYEKNPTIVTFPVKNLEMKDYLFVDGDGTDATSSNGGYPNAEEVDGMSVAQLKAVIGAHGSAADKRIAASVVEKNDLKELAQQCSQRAEVKWRQQQGTKYDLVANICHDTLSSQSVTANLTTYSSAKQSRSGGGGLVVPGTTTQQNASTAGSSGAQTGAQAAANAAAGGASVAAVLANGSYRIHVLNKATGQWYEIQDLHVSETMPQLIGLSESYILVYEKQVAKT